MPEVIAGLTHAVLADLFAAAPERDPEMAWIGDILVLPDRREVMPFAFRTDRFVSLLSQPLLEAGGDEALLAEHSQEWAQGFVPDENARIVKFCRADAHDPTTLFRPDDWKLGNPRDVFQFAELLAQVVVQHATTTVPPVRQYFYWPASEAVDKLYKRAFRVVDTKLLPGRFAPILADTGVFSGFQRV